MHVLTLSAIALPTWALGTSIAVFVMISLLMIGVILLQRPQGGGLTAAFGGSQGAGQTAFGTKTGDALTIFTCLVFAVYVGAAVFLNHGLKPQPAGAATPAAPASTTTAAPANPVPADNPAANPTTLPPGVNPGTAPATTPTSTPGTNPATTPGTTPTTTPGAAPATTPPAAVPPTTTPATTPSTAPKTPDPAAPK